MRKHLFISIPRTGTNSVRAALGIPKKNNHRSAWWIKSKYPKGWKESFTFAFVRNPFDRLVSWYTYHQDPGHLPKGATCYKRSFKDWVKHGYPHHFDNSGKMGLGGERANPLHLRDYVVDEGKIIVDWIGRFENFNQDFVILCQRLGKKPVPKLPQLNASSHKPYRSFYDNETRKRVEKMFAKDLDLFGYKF